LSNKLHRYTTHQHDNIAQLSASKNFSDITMETSQVKQTIVDLTERTDALRRYL